MPQHFLVSRRAFLIGCSVAASPLVTSVTFAAAKGENRLVIILLRGAMDGLDVVRPVGDPAFAALRPTLSLGTAPDLDGFYALHPAAAALMPLWTAGQLGFVQAVATPYRIGRSHFVAQDALENGAGAADGGMTPGARRLAEPRGRPESPVPPPTPAVSIGRERMMILDGAQPTAHWFPSEESGLSAQGQSLLAALHSADPLFADTFAQAQTLTQTANLDIPRDDLAYRSFGGYVADRLRAESRIASFSVGGWDTHQNQAKTMDDRLASLSDTILSIRDGLGKHWDTTLVLTMTEFGRTARENGSTGTDHGTGGMMIAAGGALRGGRVFGQWPGLGEGQLLGERDLLPTGDVRGYAAWALTAMFGIDAQALQSTVFPGLDMGTDPGLLL